MRKFLLSSFALLMSVAMMAVGAGDGTNKANAIDFDWTSGNIHEASGALWYCVDLAPVNAAAEPALVLYLTNLSDEEAAVDVQISLAGSQRTVSYNIAAEGYYRMDLPIAQFREFITVDQVNLALQSNQKIALSAKVYEFPEYVKEAVANSEPIDWNSGVKQDALSTKWYEVDITSLKTGKQHLQVGFINHEASKKALLTATFVLRGENITLPLVVPAGFSTTKVIDYQLLAKLPVNRIHVGVTTDSPIEVVTSTRSAIADDPTPCLNAINAEHGVTYVHEAGDTQWYKISLDLLKSTDAFSSFYLANKGNQRANVTIGIVPDCQYTTGTKITLPIPAGFELGALAPNILGNLIEELTRFESAYNKVDAKDVYLEIKTDQPIHFGLDVTNAATNPCLREDLVTFDWATGAKIEAGKATWFDMELDAVRNLGSHINFTFTNHADSLVWVATVVSVDCPAKVTMPLLVPVPARASVDQLVDYSILDAINIDNIYVGVKADGPVELKATAVNAEVIPSAGCENATVLGSGEYTQNPGTKWYQLPMSLFDEVGAAAKLSFKNLTGSTATLSAGVTVGCEYAIAHRAKVKVPKSIDLSVNVPKRILNFARQFVDNDVENFYLQLTTDKAIKFSIDLQAPDVDACRDAVEFDWAAWEKDGLQLEANQDKWYKVNLDYLFNKLENGEDLVVNLVNGSEDMDVHVLASVSPTCPALLSVEKTVDIPAGSDLYKVFTYEEVMKYVGQYDKYIYDGELEMLLGQLATYKVYNKMVELLERTPFAKFIPFGQVDLLLEAYGDHLTIAGIKDIVNNYEKYLSVAQLKEVLKTQKEYVSLQDAITLIEKYGDYIPYVDAEKILNNYEKYLPVAGGVASILKKCEKYITHENLQKVVDRCKQYLPIEEMKVLINRLKQYLPENNSCYVNIKTTGELIVKPDDPEPPTPEEPCCPEECEDVPVLDWKMVKLSNVELNKLYKLDITGLYSQSTINFFVTNDVHTDTVVIASEIYAHCQDATPVVQHSNKVKNGMSIVKVAHDKFAELVDSAQCCMFVKFTAFDTIPVTPDTPCDKVMPTENHAICAGESYEWHGQVLTAAGAYEYKETLECGVVTYTLNLAVIDDNKVMPTENHAICVGEGYEWHGQVLTAAGAYEYKETLECGVVTYTLNLAVIDDDKVMPTENHAICAGEGYAWHGQVLTAAGAYEYKETLECGVVTYTLNLAVIDDDKVMPTENHAICAGEGYAWHGQVLTAAGAYEYKETLECGVVTYTLNLAVIDDNKVMPTENHAICAGEGYAWHGQVLIAAGAYEYKETLECGVVTYTLNLAVIDDNKVMPTENHAICAGEGYAWHGQVLIAAGVYTYEDVRACGVVTYTLDLTVNNCDPCANIEELDWSDVKLSQLVEGNWYKLDFSEVHANQSSATFKATNDLNGDASVSAVAYYHCEDTEAMGNATKKLAQGHVGEREVSYKELTDMIGQAEVLYVQVTDITVAGEDCEHAIALDWSDVKLSQLVEGNWYKLDFSEVHANQLNPTFKATNDLNGDASVSAVAYYHCEDTEAMGNATKKLVQGHVGEREVSYKELTDMIGQAEVLYVQVTDITVTIVDPCADIPEIDWTKGIKLSQLQEGAMYKLNVASVHEGKADVMVSVENDLTCKTRVAASAYYDCQDDETFFEGSYAFELGAKEYVVKYDEFQDYVAEYIEYVYVQVDTIKCAEKDTVDVAEFVCDGTEYVDALGEKHIISSLIDPALLTWTAETTDTVYNYVITPIVAPAEMTAELLATIPGAMPVLVAGEKVNVAGTVEAIKNYYDLQDTEAVADVETVVWTAGADATLACEAKSHTMLLTVTSGCEFEWTVELTLDVTPVDVVETTETATICEGETYEWDGKQLSETGSYPMEITNAAGCVVEIKTLELTVTPAETVTLAAVEACDSYEWHGVTYTESGEYTYTENCKTEVLPLTIVKSETVTLAAVEACDSYEWHGVTYTESGEYTYTENCKTEVLPLTIVKSETVTLDPVVACESYEWHGVTYTESGEYTYTDNCMTEVLKLTINTTVTEEITVTECHAYTWRGETYTVSGDYTYDGDCYKEILHLTIEGQIPENNPELAEAEAVAKYGNRLVMLHLNNFVEKYGWTPAAGDVAWYQVNGDVDTSWEVENDTPLGTGYYIDSQEGYTGEVYAVINASTEDKCQNIYRTKVIALVPAGQAPKLMPTIARPSEDLHLMNLNPSNVTEVRVFNTSGELMATYQAEEASEFVFKAATLPGYYMVEVQHNGEQTTLRYIVK